MIIQCPLQPVFTGVQIDHIYIVTNYKLSVQFNIIMFIYISYYFQIQWLLTTRRSGSKTFQIRSVQTHRTERRQTFKALYRSITANVKSHSGHNAALDIVYTIKKSGRNRRVQRRFGHRYVSSE